MPTQDPGITLVQSRVQIAAGTIALFVGAIVAAVGFGRLAVSVFSTGRFPSVMIGVLVLYAAVLIFLFYLNFLGIRALLHPRKLTITADGITETRSGIVRSALWKDLGPPRKKMVSLGGGGSVFYIEFDRASAEPFLIRSDIYPESFDDILAVIEEAMAGRPTVRPMPKKWIGIALFLFAIALSVLALVHVWAR